VSIHLISYTLFAKKKWYEDVGGTDITIPFENVSEVILQKVIEWCTYHERDLYDEVDKKDTDIEEWDQEFLKKVDQGTLFELILVRILYEFFLIVALSLRG